jgi:hypothetical protein
MIDNLKDLVRELKKENNLRSTKLNDPKMWEYHPLYVHEYNNTLDIIKKIETIIGKVS